MEDGSKNKHVPVSTGDKSDFRFLDISEGSITGGIEAWENWGVLLDTNNFVEYHLSTYSLNKYLLSAGHMPGILLDQRDIAT